MSAPEMSRWTRFRCWSSSPNTTPIELLTNVLVVASIVDDSYWQAAIVFVLGAVAAVALNPGRRVRLLWVTEKIRKRGGSVTITELRR